MDLLLSQPGVDANRFAYVGHDFGGMYGVLAGSLDKRPKHYVIMAATPRFPDWYLYLPKLEGEKREAFIKQMSEIDPITHVPNLSPASVLFQFGTDDPAHRSAAGCVAAEFRSPNPRWGRSTRRNPDAPGARRSWLPMAASTRI